LGGAILGHALTPTHTRVVESSNSYSGGGGGGGTHGGDDKIIIINNGPPVFSTVVNMLHFYVS